MWLILAAALCILFIHRTTAVTLAGIAVMLAWWQSIVHIEGILILISAGLLIKGSQLPIAKWYIRKGADALVVMLCIALFLHLLPGFTHPKIVDHIHTGPQSAPFSMYLNLDKAMVPFLLAGIMPGVLAIPQRSVQVWRWLLLAAAVPALLLVAVILGGLRIEPHLPSWLPQFILINLFFVSLAEEALFRGGLQQQLQKIAGGWGGLLIASLLFGLVHLAGGVLLVVFATLSGVIYGLAWWWSGRLWVATLFHFALNLTHLLFFTYPVWQPI
ncbi:CPBP family intramembrane glutamic endopeptidase [Enterobacteriaceae bacterium LUAb1]